MRYKTGDTVFYRLNAKADKMMYQGTAIILHVEEDGVIVRKQTCYAYQIGYYKQGRDLPVRGNVEFLKFNDIYGKHSQSS